MKSGTGSVFRKEGVLTRSVGGGCLASTVHPPQQNNLRLPRRLPAAAGAIQGGVRHAVGGVCARRLGRRPRKPSGAGGTRGCAPAPSITRRSWWWRTPSASATCSGTEPGGCGGDGRGRQGLKCRKAVIPARSTGRRLPRTDRCRQTGVASTERPHHHRGVVRAGPETGNLPGSGPSGDTRGTSWPRSATGWTWGSRRRSTWSSAG